jgi:hypothetical protein
MLNESLSTIANLALLFFVMTSMIAKYKSLKVKPMKLVVGPVNGRRVEPGQSDCGQFGD